MSSLRIRVNQTLSCFSLTMQCAANNARRCSKAPKETPHRIKAPPLCATHLKKVDENFNLPNPQSVRSVRNLYSAIVPLLCPRKTPCFKVFAGPFSKGRVLLPRTPSAFPFAAFLPLAQASFSRAASFTQTQSTEAATAISSAVGKVGAIRRLRSRGSFL